MHYEENQATAKLHQIFVFENVYIQRKPETQIEVDICIPLFIATFTIAKIWKQPKCPPTGFPGGTSGNHLPDYTGDIRDAGSAPGLGRSPGGGNGNPLQYSCQENLMDRGDGGLQSIGVQSWTRLKRLSGSNNRRGECPPTDEW